MGKKKSNSHNSKVTTETIKTTSHKETPTTAWHNRTELEKNEETAIEPIRLRVRHKLESRHLKFVVEHGLIVSGSIGCGKTTLTQYLVSELMKLKIKLRVFDIVSRWKNEWYSMHSESCGYNIINEYTSRIHVKKTMLYDLFFSSVEDRSESIRRIIQHEYEKNERDFRENGKNPEHILNVIEEANCILNTKTVKGFFLDYISIGRNYNMTGVYIMQRMADSSTKVIERIPNFAFGQTKGSNDLRKIRAMLSKKEWKEAKFHELKQHEFICLINSELFKLKLKGVEKFKCSC